MTFTPSQFVAYLSLFIAIALGVLGQLAVKAGAQKASSNLDQFSHSMTMVGVLIYGIAAIFYVVALKKIPLSIAFPSVALSYIVLAIVANYLWNEPLGWRQWLGLLLIVAGVSVIHF